MKKFLLLSVVCALAAMTFVALAASKPAGKDPSLTITYYYLPG